MCASCGCGKPNDDHGDHAHITQEQIDRAATAASITPAEVAQNIQQSVSQ